jgi:hypothetical protein
LLDDLPAHKTGSPGDEDWRRSQMNILRHAFG